MTHVDLHAELTALETMNLEELRIAWVRRQKTSPPKTSAGLLRLALAHALQSKVLGGITRSTDRKLCELRRGTAARLPELDCRGRGRASCTSSPLPRTTSSTGTAATGTASASSPEPSPARAGPAQLSSGSGRSVHHEPRALCHLHSQVERGGAGAGFQQPRRAIRGLCSLHQEPGERRLGAHQGALRRGGISGGTLERPALKRLLEDIAAGRINIVVVYKVDRLTRSLLDFAKLVEAFDKAGTSFVSITQSFNTTTSIGRLTLNMLLSFAQFEREVTAERIRDKIAQSKARGMWMGGNPPIGYRPDGRSLAIVEDDAALIRHVFARYLELGNVRLLQTELLAKGMVKPSRTTSTGRTFGGTAFNRSELYNLLSNRIYVGEIVHRGKSSPGLHAPIVDPETFERARLLISRHVKGDRSPQDAAERSLLPGRVISDDGEPLIAAHTSKKTPGGKRRYRYYVSKRLHFGEGEGMRIPALELEQLVLSRLVDLLSDPVGMLAHHSPGAIVSTDAIKRTRKLAAELTARRIDHHRPIIRQLIRQVVVGETSLAIHVDWTALCSKLGIVPDPSDEELLTIKTTARLARSGLAFRMVQRDGTAFRPAPDLTLIRLIVKARDWWQRLQTERGLMVSTIAKEEGVNDSYVTRVLRLAFLSPTVVQAIIACRQPVWMDGGALCAPGAIAPEWEMQKQRLLLGRAS